jgi:shikimate kinase
MSLSARWVRFNDGAGRLERHSAMSTPQSHVPRTLVLVGLMGAGKTNIGRRLAQRLGLGFVDADSEIEAAAGETIEEIFERRGEAAFREGERKVIARLLGNPVHVLATGGGAFMDPETRALIRERGISIWLRADLDLLHHRVSRRSNRPLLKQGNPREILARLIDQRYPVYAEADVTVDTVDGPPEATLEHVMAALEQHLAKRAVAEEPTP